MAFELYGGPESLPFLNKLENALIGLPVIGDTAYNEVLALAHYSRDGAIVSFKNQYIVSWTNKVAANPAIIGNLTGLHGRKYCSICLIRLGVGAIYKPRTHGYGIQTEYAIDIDVSPEQFAQLPLAIDANTGFYM